MPYLHNWQFTRKTGRAKGRSLSLRDSKTSLKARVAGSDKELAARDKTIEVLRRELATANERIARQASHYQDELRRLGGGAKTGRPLPDRATTDKPDGSGAQTSSSVTDGAEKILETADVGGHDEAVSAQRAKTIVNGGDKKQSLEARLSAVETDTNEAAPDFDEHADASEPDRKRSRGKLMDRIAGLAKR